MTANPLCELDALILSLSKGRIQALFFAAPKRLELHRQFKVLLATIYGRSLDRHDNQREGFDALASTMVLGNQVKRVGVNNKLALCKIPVEFQPWRLSLRGVELRGQIVMQPAFEKKNQPQQCPSQNAPTEESPCSDTLLTSSRAKG